MGDHRLVGGDERLARRDGVARQGERRSIRAADQLDHDVDIVARSQGGHVVLPGIGREVDAAILGAVARAHRR
jgi:hypothetical protein